MGALRQVLSPDDVYITDELQHRPAAKTDYLQEKLALQDLAQQMVDHPADVLPHLVDLAMEICDGTSAGISLFEATPAPGIFRWRDLRGVLAKFEGATTPRRFSPAACALTRTRRFYPSIPRGSTPESRTPTYPSQNCSSSRFIWAGQSRGARYGWSRIMRVILIAGTAAC
jgi:hypothetical protein